MDFIGVIREEASTFASAAVPTVRTIAQDAIYISSFLPLNDASVWRGRIDAFARPLPLDAEGMPDESHDNHLWEAGSAAICVAEAPTVESCPLVDEDADASSSSSTSE